MCWIGGSGECPPGSTVLFTNDMAMFIVSDRISTVQSSFQICLNLANLCRHLTDHKVFSL